MQELVAADAAGEVRGPPPSAEAQKRCASAVGGGSREQCGAEAAPGGSSAGIEPPGCGTGSRPEGSSDGGAVAAGWVQVAKGGSRRCAL